ncbi:hypothetical protein GVAV_001186 [Gurleya vavrai]
MESSSDNNEFYSVERNFTLSDLAKMKGFKLPNYYEGTRNICAVKENKNRENVIMDVNKQNDWKNEEKNDDWNNDGKNEEWKNEGKNDEWKNEDGRNDEW